MKQNTYKFLAGLLLLVFCGTLTGRAQHLINNMGTNNNGTELQRATFGGGCFWCVEAIFERVKGVTAVTSGYAGGNTPNPDYKSVCSGTTGHAEVIQVEFDPETVSYEDLLFVFWRAHDPTQLNRQGNDVGTQYRSIILYHTPEQKQKAEASLQETDSSDLYSDKIVTEIAPLEEFYPAEKYHQGYYDDNRDAPYCRFVIDPKVKKFMKSHEEMLREGATQ